MSERTFNQKYRDMERTAKKLERALKKERSPAMTAKKRRKAREWWILVQAGVGPGPDILRVDDGDTRRKMLRFFPETKELIKVREVLPKRRGKR